MVDTVRTLAALIAEAQDSTGYSAQNLRDFILTASAWSGTEIQAAKTADYTVALSDRGTLIPMNSASDHVFFINTDALVDFGIGARLYFGRMGAGAVTISATTPGTTTITPAGGGDPMIRGEACIVFAIKMAANLWWLGGELA